jgi:hypothetical protein
MSPRSSIGYAQNDFLVYCMFGVNRAPILHRGLHYLQTHQKELSFDPHHLGGPSGAAKKIFMPGVTFGANYAPILR